MNYNIRTSDRRRGRSCGKPLAAHSILRLQSAVRVLYSESRHFSKLTDSEASCALYTHPALIFIFAPCISNTNILLLTL
jgi:hypothetical protein